MKERRPDRGSRHDLAFGPPRAPEQHPPQRRRANDADDQLRFEEQHAGDVGGRQECRDEAQRRRAQSNHAGRTVLIATGVAYRQLTAPGMQKLTGRGVYYGATLAEAPNVAGQDVYLVGGANSAGQANHR